MTGSHFDGGGLVAVLPSTFVVCETGPLIKCYVVVLAASLSCAALASSVVSSTSNSVFLASFADSP